MAFLAGKKTYLIAVALAGLSAAKYLGYVDESTAHTIELVLLGGGLAALRAAR